MKLHIDRSKKSLPFLLAAVAVAGLLAALPLVAQPHGSPGQHGGPGQGHGPGGGPGAQACAGGPGGQHGAGGLFGGRGFERLARFLELTEEQRQQAQAIHQAAREQARPILEENVALRGELRDLLEQADPDPAAVGALVIAKHANRGEIRQIFEETHAAFEALLTPEQLDKLQDFRDRRRGGHGGGGEEGGGLF